MSNKISIDEVISQEDHQKIIEMAANYAARGLNSIADIMDEINAGPHPGFMGKQFLGLITQHLFKTSIANAFLDNNEIDVIGKLVTSCILEGYNQARTEEAARAEARSTPKEETH